MANAEASIGHAARCRELYEKALGLAKNDTRIMFDYAARMQMWGDFYRTERIFRDHLSGKPSDRKVRIMLGNLLASTERYEEAEYVLRKLIADFGTDTEASEALANIRIRQDLFDDALKISESMLPSAEIVRGRIFLEAGRYDAAIEAFGRVAGDSKHRVESLIGLGISNLRKKNTGTASEYFGQAAKSEPANITALFHLEFAKDANPSEVARRIIESGKWTPVQLAKFADMCVVNSMPGEAELFCRHAVGKDPDCFPAQICLAQILASSNRYGESLDIYNRLEAQLGATRKILIEKARVLSWSKQYRDAIREYTRLTELNPADPVPVREMARVAAWAKMMKDSMAYYAKLVTPTVDSRLSAVLAPILERTGDANLREACRILQKEKHLHDPPYQGFEEILAHRDTYLRNLSGADWETVASSLLEMEKDHQLQKKAWLESRAKYLQWCKKPVRAISTCEELLGIEPANHEAMFDYAQMLYSVGLHEKANKTYLELQRIDPSHNLVPVALETEEISTHPAVQLGETFWTEDGRGDISGISRVRTDITLDLPFWRQAHLSVSKNSWQEKTRYDDKTHGSEGATVAASFFPSRYFSGSASWTVKQYEDTDLTDTKSGHAGLAFNLRDYAKLDLEYRKTDELYNYFGMMQGLQADTWKIQLSSDITRALEAKAYAQYLDYSDENEGMYCLAAIGYAFTDHPRIFKMTVTGEYRDTKENYLALYYDNYTFLANIIHPYWCPRNYNAETLTLEWLHDLSSFFFHGAPRHYYDLKLSFSLDSEEDPAVRAEVEWRCEFLKHFAAGLRGIVHRSKLWDADGVSAEISYRF